MTYHSQMVPIITEARYGNAPIIIGFLIIAILLGLGFYLFGRSHHVEYPEGREALNIDITNKTQLPYTISLVNGKDIILEPDETTKLSVDLHDSVYAKSKNYDGTPVEHTYIASNKNATDIFITPDGFRTNVTASDNVRFVNEAPYPVMFIQRSSKGDRRWATDIVPPHSTVEGHLVGRNSTWQVAHPTNENKPIDEVSVKGISKSLEFNGQHLRAY